MSRGKKVDHLYVLCNLLLNGYSILISDEGDLLSEDEDENENENQSR
jgi:hypothetical protein